MWEENNIGGYTQNNEEPTGPLESLSNLNQQAGQALLNLGGQALQKYDEIEQGVLPMRRPAIQGTADWVDNNLTSLLKRFKLTEPYAEKAGDIAGLTTDVGLEIFSPGLEETTAATLTAGAALSPLPVIDEGLGALATGGLYGKNVFKRAAKELPNYQRILNGVFDGSWKRVDGERVFVTPEGVRIDTNNIDLNPNIMQSKGGGGFVQPELPIQRFQTVPYQQNVVAKMSEFGMSDGTFRMKAFDANKGKFKGNTKERRMLEAYLSPDRLKGSFSGFKNANKGTWQRTWGDFLESKGLSGIDDIQVHHINALYDSIHLFDGVKFNSKEYWDIIATLIGRNARPGTIQRTGDVNNLMMTLGKATNIETPHGIAHKLYNDLTPSFFSPKEMSRITNPKGFTDEAGKVWKPGEYRIYKAQEWAKIVNQSEEVILEAHKQWSALNPKIDVSFDDLIEYMSNFDDTGFNKLLSNEYQLPDIKNMVMDIKLDMMLNPLKNIPFPKLSELKQEILRDRAAGMSNKELKRKYGKNLDIKQLDLFDQ